MEKNGLNRKRLAEKAGIPYTTIVGWYNRGYENMSLSAFSRICAYFGVTMDSMARDDIKLPVRCSTSRTVLPASPEELEVLRQYVTADRLDRLLVKRALGMSIESDKFKAYDRSYRQADSSRDPGKEKPAIIPAEGSQ